MIKYLLKVSTKEDWISFAIGCVITLIGMGMILSAISIAETMHSLMGSLSVGFTGFLVLMYGVMKM